MQFKKAKDIEVKNFIAAECFELAKDRLPDEYNVLGMRWLLTWKYDDKYQDGRKAKARAIVLGYQDPSYADRKTAAPTPSRASRQLFFQLCSWKRFKMAKGDISGAFLQGDDLTEELWCRPLKEITEKLEVKEGTPMLMKKAAYGLVQAPLHWYESISRFLSSLGYQKLLVEPCCWIWKDETGCVRSIIHGHVDDFLFGGRDYCKIHRGLMEKIKQAYDWGTWETDHFVQCGIDVCQKSDYSIELKQDRFIDEMTEIFLTKDRSRQVECPTTDEEKRKLRGALGSLSWVTGQTCFLYAVDVNHMLTKIPQSTVADIVTTNKIIRDMKKMKDQVYKIHAFDEHAPLEFIAWSDAAWANRPNEVDSTEGIFIGMCTPKLREGFHSPVTPVFWKSGCINRVCRSPATAETMAALNTEDDLTYVWVMWSELLGHNIQLRDVDHAASLTKGTLVTDSKNLYDKLHRATPVVKGPEKRADIEALSLRQNLQRSQTTLRWVEGGAMLANVLTKCHEKAQGWLFLSLDFTWKLVYDQNMCSSKKRRAAGIQPLQDTQHSHVRAKEEGET